LGPTGAPGTTIDPGLPLCATPPFPDTDGLAKLGLMPITSRLYVFGGERRGEARAERRIQDALVFGEGAIPDTNPPIKKWADANLPPAVSVPLAVADGLRRPQTKFKLDTRGEVPMIRKR
jgi:hypothetical protein